MEKPKRWLSITYKEGVQGLVKPGEEIPIDGEIYEGISEVNESMSTGESLPAERKSGMKSWQRSSRKKKLIELKN